MTNFDRNIQFDSEQSRKRGHIILLFVRLRASDSFRLTFYYFQASANALGATANAGQSCRQLLSVISACQF